MGDPTAQEREDLHNIIRGVLGRNRLAVLATQRGGQPHASLMAFTPLEELRHLLFATYRDTLKYESLREDRRVAVLVEERAGDVAHPGRRLVLTALGEALETPPNDREGHIAMHLARHPDLEEFVRSPDCALVRVAVQSYQVVGGIDDVRWYKVDESAAT